ncbi:MAG TPA: hypothetical protein VMB34_12010 [Acetobacteraceae bacterium]|nr:hypothetical protein [Acetobacteraceae bacterium]
MHAMRRIAVGLAVMGTLGAGVLATPANADWHHHYWHGHWYHGCCWGPPAVVVAPRPYYYAPPPVYYAPPPPVVYAPPAYYAPPGIGIGVTIR